jgi:subtilisin-like proprotein convertase family protein
MNAFRIVRGLLVACALATASLSLHAAQGTTNFSNPERIVIPVSGTTGPASPYPSAIAVSGLRGNISNVSVTLNGASHTYIGDLLIRVVSPDGQIVNLHSRAGGSINLVDTTSTFRSNATTTWQAQGVNVPSGTYLPAGDLSVFNGAAAAKNGNWLLYIDDQLSGDAGEVARGWTLSIVSDVFTTCAAEGYTGSKLTMCQKVCESNYSGSTLNALIRMYVAAYREQPACAL